MTPHELAAKAVPGYATDNEIEALIEPILIAAGSSLKHYCLYKPREEMRQAMRAALAPLQAQIAMARDDALREAALMAGSLAETTYDTMPCFKVCLDIEARIRSLITTPAPELEDNKTISEFVNRQQRLGPEFEKAIFDNIEELYESDGTPAPEKE